MERMTSLALQAKVLVSGIFMQHLAVMTYRSDKTKWIKLPLPWQYSVAWNSVISLFVASAGCCNCSIFWEGSFWHILKTLVHYTVSTIWQQCDFGLHLHKFWPIPSAWSFLSGLMPSCYPCFYLKLIWNGLDKFWLHRRNAPRISHLSFNHM